MANGLILGLAASDTAAFSGGAWAATLPLANVLTQQPTEVARSADALPASTQFVLDFGRSEAVSVVALIAHNLSGDALVRIRLSDSPTLAGATIDVVRRGREANTVFGQRPWGNFPWNGFDARAVPAGGLTTIYQHPSIVAGRYLAIEITDPGNPDGFVQLGRFMAGIPMQPRFNFTYGASLGVIDESTISRAIGGALWADVKPRRRRLSVSYDALRASDAWGWVHDFGMQLGVTGNLLAVYDPAAPEGMRARGIVYGRIESLSDVVQANASIDAPFTAAIPIEELV